TLNVLKGSQTIVWNAPADIVYGTPLGAAQLNAVVTGSGPSAPGTLSYAPAADMILDAGPHTLVVTAAATSNYNAATATVTLNVLKAEQTIVWDDPPDIVDGTPLADTPSNTRRADPRPGRKPGAPT